MRGELPTRRANLIRGRRARPPLTGLSPTIATGARSGHGGQIGPA